MGLYACLSWGREAGGGRDDIVGEISFFQNKLDCFVHEQFGVEAKAKVIERFPLLKGMSRREGESREKLEEGRNPGRFLTWCFAAAVPERP